MLFSPFLYVHVHHSVNLPASLHFVSPLASVPSSVPIGMRCCCRAHMGLILSCSILRLDLPLPIKEEKCPSLLLPSPPSCPPPPLWLRQTCPPLSLSPPVNCSLIEAAVSRHPLPLSHLGREVRRPTSFARTEEGRSSTAQVLSAS